MSILERMVSTDKRYKSDNFPSLRCAVLRGEHLYQVRLYNERASFQSAQSGVLRMRMLLGFIEARAVVIDAVIKTEGTLHYLSVLCASAAVPLLFSRIMNRTAPGAVIEEIDRRNAEDCIASRAVRDSLPASIPFAAPVRTVNESRRALLSLLLEYRALLAEYGLSGPVRGELARSRNGEAMNLCTFLIFEHNGSVCGIPDFQVAGIVPGANGSYLLDISLQFGTRIIICDDLLCMKEIDILRCEVSEKRERGYYRASVPATGGPFSFTLIVPSFL